MAKKPNLKTITSGYAATTALNENFEALRDALDNTVSRDGSVPNSMSADLDMNSQDILNVNTINTSSMILNGTLVVPSGVDPVFSGTVSTFGAGFISEPSALSARAALGLGDLATQSLTYVNTNVQINNDNWSGSDLDIVNGGTGASSAGAARNNLGLGSAATTDILDEDDMASNSATDVPSQQSVKSYADAIQNTVLGVDQVWVDVSASRAANTSYQNTTGKPITVLIDDTGGANSFQVSTDNSVWLTLYTYPSGTGTYERSPVTVIIPNLHYYKFTGAFIRWSELR